MFYGSAHVDPGRAGSRTTLGFADETGRARAWAANRNVPVAPGAGDDGWLAALDAVCCAAWRRSGPDAVVLSLGVDAAADDPESPLRVTVDGYRRSGALVRDLGVPVVAVHEGGYHLPTLGALTVAVLEGVTGVTSG